MTHPMIFVPNLIHKQTQQPILSVSGKIVKEWLPKDWTGEEDYYPSFFKENDGIQRLLRNLLMSAGKKFGIFKIHFTNTIKK